jgi:DNA-binding NarL/FixJ family response regulator
VFHQNSTEFFAYLENCKTIYPSLILLDMNAVPLNARDVLRELKASSGYSHIPVVVLSEMTNTKLVKDCYALGASSFIMKPDSVERTNKKIMSFLEYWFETVELV